ncbi:hypothetical protein [Aliikangiella coralliicola]|uniref:Thioredoxin-like fold domain-containing protein n=1 Tax=Aliikangiella coralliicola TaxID=2592383 RepID=A0A545UI37_9GAMM|nr:hypothetical protein [Aliikangiella coralliicola]TQV89137.1 hypothetical protein FLL46_03140 [Aliikangiella coralliicola]
MQVVKASESVTANQLANNDQPDNFIEGVDYRLLQNASIDNAIELDQLQQVVDIEIFYWYGCEPCQQTEQALSEYLQTRSELTVRRTPLVAYLSWRPQAYLQPMLEQLEGSVQLPSQDELYRQCIEDCSVFSDLPASIEWIKQRYNINEMPRLDESKIWQTEKNYRKRANSFSISQVPTIIIRESYITDANSAKSLPRLMAIIEHLLGKSPN